MIKTISDQQKSEILTKIIDFCHSYLSDDKIARKYLEDERQLQGPTIEKFKLGAFPSNLFTAVKAIGANELHMAGLLKYKDGKEFSKFVFNRIIIPVYDVHNRPLAIMGRTLLSKERMELLGVNKYDNTSFKKSSCLFGLNLAKHSIREKDEAIVVEGNLDVIMAHQHGLTNVVATSCASLSKNQFLLLSRYTPKITVMFDNDEAGKAGMELAVKKYGSKDGVVVEQKQLPNAVKDLDEFFRKSTNN